MLHRFFWDFLLVVVNSLESKVIYSLPWKQKRIIGGQVLKKLNLKTFIITWGFSSFQKHKKNYILVVSNPIDFFGHFSDVLG